MSLSLTAEQDCSPGNGVQQWLGMQVGYNNHVLKLRKRILLDGGEPNRKDTQFNECPYSKRGWHVKMEFHVSS